MDAEALGGEEAWADFGNSLRKHREACGWSQPQLVKELARHYIRVASQGTVSKWESGRQRPNPETAEVLEDIFDLPRGTLLNLLRYPVEGGVDGGNEAKQRSTNWIEEYEAKHGRLPPLPEPLGRLVMNYVQVQPVRKDMVVGFANMGQWNAIKGVPGLEKKWREFLEWLGQDPDEYEYKVRSLGPPKRNPHPLVWKPTKRP